MSLNYKEINCILDELQLEGSFIQQIRQPSYDSIALYLYRAGKARTLLICLGAGACRLHETRKAIPRNDKPLRFMEFLRSRIKGARIDEAAQLGNERIVRLLLSHGEESFAMYIRLWSNAANIIVTDRARTNAEGAELILDVFYRRPKKNEVTGGFYTPVLRNTEEAARAEKPLIKEGIAANQGSGDELPPRSRAEATSGGNTGTAPKERGESGSAASNRAASNRVASKRETSIKCDTEETLNPTVDGTPQTDTATCKAAHQTDAKPKKEFTVRTFDELDASGALTFNQKVEQWYSEHAEALSRTALLEAATKQYQSHKSRLEHAIARLEAKRETFLHAEQWKHRGDLILTYGELAERATANGEKSIECTDYETDATVCIAIDPHKKAQENAADYYERYKKAVSGLTELEYDIKASKSDLAKLTADYETLLAEQNPLVIQQTLRKQNKPRQQIEKKHPGLDFYIDDWHILVGRTAAENDELLRRHVKGQDWWLHTRDVPGGYVFIKNKVGKTVPLEVLLDAGNLAVFYSKARKAARADLYYTQVKHLRRAKNAPKGTVLPTHEKNLSITLDAARLKRIESQQKDGAGMLL